MSSGKDPLTQESKFPNIHLDIEGDNSSSINQDPTPSNLLDLSKLCPSGPSIVLISCWDSVPEVCLSCQGLPILPRGADLGNMVNF